MKIAILDKITSWFKKDGKDLEKEVPEKTILRRITHFFTGKKEDVEKEISSDKKEPTQETQEKKKSRPPRPKKPPKKRWDVSNFVVEPCDGKVRFHDLEVPNSIMHGICDLGFEYCTSIQGEILPNALNGQDVTGQAQTGTGKSAAFLITILTQLIRTKGKVRRFKSSPRALILAPTRELAIQIEKDANSLSKYTPFKTVAVFGGLGYEKQKKHLTNKFVDIVVATPGRLIDFKQKHILELNRVEYLVIDEADRMLDMGFIPDIRKIVNSTPVKSKRQTMFFSATLNDEVDRYARQWTNDSFRVEIEPEHVASDSIEQIIYIVTAEEKFPLLYNMITDKGNELNRVIIFTNRKDQARRLSEKLNSYGIDSTVLSGDVAQNKRLHALENFRSGKIRVLVATDVAARGIHIDDISHVINYNFPNDPEHYIHRIGRTGRAGSKGIAISFACEDDSFYIPAIEKVLGNELKCEYPEEALFKKIPAAPKKKTTKHKSRSGHSQKKRTYSKSKNYKQSSKSKYYKKRPKKYSKNTKPPVKKQQDKSQ